LRFARNGGGGAGRTPYAVEPLGINRRGYQQKEHRQAASESEEASSQRIKPNMNAPIASQKPSFLIHLASSAKVSDF
jgi:hypothetical protein